MGLVLRGGVYFPVLSPSSEGFNIVNILTFVVQIGNGFFTIISLASTHILLHTPNWEQGNISIITKFLAGKESYAFFDISSFFLLISGAMNYFVVTNFYDQYYKKEVKY